MNVEPPVPVSPCLSRSRRTKSTVAVILEGTLLKIVSIDERWEDVEGWWKDNPVVKMHYQVSLGDGRQMTLFRNFVTGGWYWQDGHYKLPRI